KPIKDDIIDHLNHWKHRLPGLLYLKPQEGAPMTRRLVKTIQFPAHALALLTILMAAAHGADVKESADHPLIPRYEGSEIVAYDTQAYTQKTFARAALKAGKLEDKPDAALKLEGKLSSITYRAPENRSALEVARNYQAALENAGFSMVFSCS